MEDLISDDHCQLCRIWQLLKARLCMPIVVVKLLSYPKLGRYVPLDVGGLEDENLRSLAGGA